MGSSVANTRVRRHWHAIPALGREKGRKGAFSGRRTVQAPRGPAHPGLVFLCGEAVYDHAMTALKWTAAALVMMLAVPANADVSGPACVTDGDTLVVNGKRERTRCVGGTRVRLFGTCYTWHPTRARDGIIPLVWVGRFGSVSSVGELLQACLGRDAAPPQPP